MSHSRMASRLFAGKSGFSLIELLVVMTVVAVLVALLLPALSKARENAMHMRCSAQMHQHAIAMSSYQADYKDYYPSFGGDVVNDYSNWYRTNGNGNGAFYNIDYNPGSRAYFREYLVGHRNSTGSLATQKSQAVSYCPAIDWQVWQPYVFTASGYTFSYFLNPIPYSGGITYAGYNFYPGQKFYANTYASDFDTRPRRYDNRELLMTDLVSKIQNTANTGSSVYKGVTLTSSIAFPWFNPHSGNGNTVNPMDSFHQLAASGAVSTFPTSEARFTNNWGSGGTTGMYSKASKTKANLTGNDALRDGPYFQVP